MYFHLIIIFKNYFLHIMLVILSLVVTANSLTTTYKEAACSHKEKNVDVFF